jgi:AcrR family transcriptional regulator
MPKNAKKEEVEATKRDYPLRSKRRLATRAALIKSAMQLMAERGFDDVTMQQVADHAGTHAQTLYSHFPNKYALCAAAAVESLRVSLEGRKTDTLTFWRKWVKKRTQEATTYEGAGALSGLISDTLDKPRFALVNLAVTKEYVKVLTTNLAADLSLDHRTDLLPSLVAQMLMSASEHSIMAWEEAKGDYDLLEAELNGIDEVAEIVRLTCEARGIVIKRN